jgi:hypothetical protein
MSIALERLPALFCVSEEGRCLDDIHGILAAVTMKELYDILQDEFGVFG